MHLRRRSQFCAAAQGGQRARNPWSTGGERRAASDRGGRGRAEEVPLCRSCRPIRSSRTRGPGSLSAGTGVSPRDLMLQLGLLPRASAPQTDQNVTWCHACPRRDGQEGHCAASPLLGAEHGAPTLAEGLWPTATSQPHVSPEQGPTYRRRRCCRRPWWQSSLAATGSDVSVMQRREFKL